jgi:hypothetical protein
MDPAGVSTGSTLIRVATEFPAEAFLDRKKRSAAEWMPRSSIVLSVCGHSGPDQEVSAPSGLSAQLF